MAQEMERNAAGLPVRELGKTGLKVSIIGIGGGHLVRPTTDEQMSIRLVHAAIDAGVTFMDNAWEYHDGESERRMGLALKGRRDQVTLMTKVCARDRKTAEAQLEDSLRRLQTARVGDHRARNAVGEQRILSPVSPACFLHLPQLGRRVGRHVTSQPSWWSSCITTRSRCQRA